MEKKISVGWISNWWCRRALRCMHCLLKLKLLLKFLFQHPCNYWKILRFVTVCSELWSTWVSLWFDQLVILHYKMKITFNLKLSIKKFNFKINLFQPMSFDSISQNIVIFTIYKTSKMFKVLTWRSWHLSCLVYSWPEQWMLFKARCIKLLQFFLYSFSLYNLLLVLN